MKLKNIKKYLTNLIGKYYYCKLQGKHRRRERTSIPASGGMVVYICRRCGETEARKVRAKPNKGGK